MSRRYVDSEHHGKAAPPNPALPPVDLPRENDGYIDLEASLQAEVREREIEDGLDD
jgi:hypothetical protein